MSRARRSPTACGGTGRAPGREASKPPPTRISPLAEIAQPCVTPVWRDGCPVPRSRETPKVLCPECDAELSPQREFCLQCGTPTSPRLREARSSDRAEPELQRSRRRAVVLGAVGLFGAAIL